MRWGGPGPPWLCLTGAMYVVIAPDKFKGSLTAAQAAEHLARPFEAAGIRVATVPMADGGEGTVDAAHAAGYSRITCEVTGPLGRAVLADYAYEEATATAVIEMALASGLAMTSATDADARVATSRGTGELIAHALDAGARRIILGVGGSASTDGGAGMMRGLGAKLYGPDGGELPDGGVALGRMTRVDLTGLHPGLGQAKIVLAADVDNPLLGEHGAAEVYGPQKGAAPHTVAELDAALAMWDRVLREGGYAAPGSAHHPGAGAAGGVGYAAIALLGVRREQGIDVVLDLTGFAEQIVGADLVITGEGSLDEQSLRGKTPVGVAQAAAGSGVRTIAVAGRSDLPQERIHAAGIHACYQILDIAPDPDTAMREAGPLLEELGRRIIADHLAPEKEPRE